MMDERERRARIGLAAAGLSGDYGCWDRVRAEGAEQAWEKALAGEHSPKLALRLKNVDVDEVLRDTDRIGARIIVPGDPEWPQGLNDLAQEDDDGIGGEPLCLWVIGDLGSCLATPSVAVVGARASTAYGELVASRLAAGIAGEGHAVVSGGAYGIDASAHRSALGVGGKTVAVMASGLDKLFPPGNLQLLNLIGEVGALVSEQPPGSPPSRPGFLARNRLIAAMSQAMVVVEGAQRSGAQNSARWASMLSRPLLAVPGPVTSPMSFLPHKLIREGRAILAGDAEDVLAALVDGMRP